VLAKNNKMKNNNIFLIILLSLVIPFIMTSCEKSDVQTNKFQADSTHQITNRSNIDDCEDCPNDNCCCVVELIDGSPANLLFCGIYTAMIGSTCGPFSPPSPCGTVSGLSSTINLGMSDPARQLFCLATGGSFRVQNIGTETVQIRITCQSEEVDPDWETIELEPTDIFYFDSDSGCFLVECN
jgi:hypothetical protein